MACRRQLPRAHEIQRSNLGNPTDVLQKKMQQPDEAGQPVTILLDDMLKELDNLVLTSPNQLSAGSTMGPATPDPLRGPEFLSAPMRDTKLLDRFFQTMQTAEPIIEERSIRDSITTVCTEQGRIVSYPPRPPRIQTKITVEQLMAHPRISGWLQCQSMSPLDSPPLSVETFVVLSGDSLYFFPSENASCPSQDTVTLHPDSIVQICDGEALEISASPHSIRLRCRDHDSLAAWFHSLQQAVLALNRPAPALMHHHPVPVRAKPAPLITKQSPTSPWFPVDQAMPSPRKISPLSPHIRAPSSAASQPSIPSVLLSTASTASRKKTQSCDIYDFVNQVCLFVNESADL
jgi:hypothetical protein